jgi:hypothetical protein
MVTPIKVYLDPEWFIPDPSHSGPNTQGQEKNDMLYGKGNVIGLQDFLKLFTDAEGMCSTRYLDNFEVQNSQNCPITSKYDYSGFDPTREQG